MAADQSTGLPSSMSLTENGSFTFGTTESACLNFYFDVLQKTPSPVIKSHLDQAWAEDALLTLKLIFQLRDIRKGKGAKIEFHHCLLWLYEHHPLTLIENVQHVAQHGYWKDLGWLIKFIMTGDVSMTTERTKRVGHRSRDRYYSRYTPAPMPTGNLEEVINQRLKGEITKKSWKKYLTRLNSGAKKVARKRFEILSKEFELNISRRAKEAKKAARLKVAKQLQELKTKQPKFVALYDKVVQTFANTLKEDKETLVSTNCLPTTALCGKWAPTLNCSIDSHTLLGKNIVRALFPAEGNRRVDETEKSFFDRMEIAYRKEYLIPLREAIKVVEAQMSRKQWDKIEYNRVPSVSMKRNTKNFQKRDKERFTEYLGQVFAGEKKIASGALLPHEIVSRLMTLSYSYLRMQRGKKRGVDDLSEQVAELQWKSYVDNLKKSGVLDSALAVADVSGSMAGTPMQVAIALSILTAELSKPPFNEQVCTFSATPQLIRINQPTLRQKIKTVQHMDWGMNTNFQAVFNLLLDLAVREKTPPSEMIRTIFVFSDMEFDECEGQEYETDYQLIKRKYSEAGYPMPQIVFWNLRGGNRSKPVTKNEAGVALVSGFSGQMMRVFLENGTCETEAETQMETETENPYQTMLKSLGNQYDHLKVVD